MRRVRSIIAKLGLWLATRLLDSELVNLNFLSSRPLRLGEMIELPGGPHEFTCDGYGS